MELLSHMELTSGSSGEPTYLLFCSQFKMKLQAALGVNYLEHLPLLVNYKKGKF